MKSSENCDAVMLSGVLAIEECDAEVSSGVLGIENCHAAMSSGDFGIGKLSARISSGVFEIEKFNPVVASGNFSMSSSVVLKNGLQASAAARKLLRQDDCDPRRPDLFGEIEMSSLRDLLCGVLSKHDRRPWCSNGKRITVGRLIIYLGTTFKSVNILMQHFDLNNEIFLFRILKLIFISCKC